MKKWKYMSIYAPKHKPVDNEGLNDMGSKGWELICVLYLGNRWKYVFKQPLEEETEKVEEAEDPRPEFLKYMPKNMKKYDLSPDIKSNGKFEVFSICTLDYLTDSTFLHRLEKSGYKLIGMTCTESAVREGMDPTCVYAFMREKPADES